MMYSPRDNNTTIGGEMSGESLNPVHQLGAAETDRTERTFDYHNLGTRLNNLSQPPKPNYAKDGYSPEKKDEEL